MPPPTPLKIERVIGGRINLKGFGTGAAFLRYNRARPRGDEDYMTDVECSSDEDDD